MKKNAIFLLIIGIVLIIYFFIITNNKDIIPDKNIDNKDKINNIDNNIDNKDKINNIDNNIDNKDNNINNSDNNIDNKDNNILTLTINGNGFVNNQTLTCIKVNNSCSIKLPILSQKENQFLAYNDNKNSNEVQYTQNSNIILNSNKTIYVIKEENITLTLNINLNGASSISNNNLSCITTKRINSCSITLPEGTRINGEFYGYNKTNSTIATYKPGSTYKLTSFDNTLYAISSVKYNATINGANYVISNGINNNVISCNAYNTNNSCSITLPHFYKLGYTSFKDYTYNNETLNVGSKLELNSDIKLTANPKLFQYDITVFSFEDEIYNNTVILYSTKINDISKHKDYISRIKQYAPYMLTNADAIAFITDGEMSKLTKNAPVGLTASHVIHVQSSAKITTLVHELMHSETNAIKTITGKDKNKIAKDIGVYSTYSTYQYSEAGSRPISEYAYTSINEFLSECFKYYYERYIEKSVNKTLPDNIVSGMEKLVCIIKDYNNNYANYDKCINQ